MANIDVINGHTGVETEPLLPSMQLPLPELCARIHARVTAFLDDEPKNDQIRAVQEETRTSLKVIEEALGRYRSVKLTL